MLLQRSKYSPELCVSYDGVLKISTNIRRVLTYFIKWTIRICIVLYTEHTQNLTYVHDFSLVEYRGRSTNTLRVAFSILAINQILISKIRYTLSENSSAKTAENCCVMRVCILVTQLSFAASCPAKFAPRSENATSEKKSFIQLDIVQHPVFFFKKKEVCCVLPCSFSFFLKNYFPHQHECA